MGNLHKISPPKIPKFVQIAQEEILQKCLTFWLSCGKIYIEGERKRQNASKKNFLKNLKKSLTNLAKYGIIVIEGEGNKPSKQKNF